MDKVVDTLSAANLTAATLKVQTATADPGTLFLSTWFVDVNVKNVGFLAFWQFLRETSFSADIPCLHMPPGVDVLGDDGPILFVRECYSTFLNIVTDPPAFAHRNNKLAFTIMGNPGVGKTFFSAYLLWYLASKRVNVIYEPPSDPHIRYYLSANGETRLTLATDICSLTLEDKKNTWYITDAHRPVYRISTRVNRTVVVTSPRRAVYKEWSKQMQARVRYMPVWSDTDIATYCKYAENVSYDKLCMRSQFGGGIARTMLSDRTDAELKDDIEHAISEVSLSGIMGAISNMPTAKTIPHRLVVMVPCSNFRKFTYEFASPYIRDEISKHFFASHRRKILNLIRATEGIGPYGPVRGFFFEGQAHAALTKGAHFKYRYLDDDTKEVFDLPLARLQTVIYEKLDIKFEPGKYFRPKIMNAAAIDSMMWPNLFFQFTVSRRHPIKLNHLNQVMRATRCHKKEAILMFVVPQSLFRSFRSQRYIGSDGKVVDPPSKVRQAVLAIPGM